MAKKKDIKVKVEDIVTMMTLSMGNGWDQTIFRRSPHTHTHRVMPCLDE